MIIVQIQGGFGNQLFQYAFGLHLRSIYNFEVKFNTSFFSNQNQFSKSGNSVRNFDLFELLHLKGHNNSKLNSEFVFITNYYSFINRFLKRFNLFFYNWKLFRFYKEESFNTNLFLLESKVNLILDGYWQDSSFIDETFIYKMQNLLDRISHPFFSNDINGCQSVSVHVRRDDYVNHKVFVVLSNDYYNAAIKYLSSKISNPHFYLFSDDNFSENDLKKLIQLFPENSIKIINPQSTLLDFYLMYKCSHNIVANSTFSWWASILNKNTDKVMLAPYQWTKNEFVDNEIITKLLSKHIIVN
jgi:hypothetical protein